MQAIERQSQVTEEKIITPLVEVLGIITPKPTNEQAQVPKSLKQSLDNLFPEQQYNKNIQVAKGVLGDLANKFSPEELRDTLSEIQYLAESWLDEFERKTFNGLTLKELLHEKGSL